MELQGKPLEHAHVPTDFMMITMEDVCNVIIRAKRVSLDLVLTSVKLAVHNLIDMKREIHTVYVRMVIMTME